MNEPPLHAPYLSPKTGAGLSLAKLDDWIEPSPDLSRCLTFKRDTLTLRGREAFRARKSSIDPGNEALLLLSKYLSTQYPDDYALWGDYLAVTSSEEKFPIRQTLPLHPLYIAGRLVPDDLFILDKRKERWSLTAASICSPCDWRLEAKIGESLGNCPGLIPGILPNMEAEMAAHFDALLPDQVSQRFSWRLCPSNELFLIGASGTQACREIADLAEIQTRLWVRVKRQSFRKLAKTGAVFVTIRTSMDRLDRVAEHADLRTGLSNALDDMTETDIKFLAMASFRGAALDYLQNRMPVDRRVSKTGNT